MEAEKRIKLRANTPYEEVLELFRTFNYLTWCYEHKLFVEQELTVNPLHWYNIFNNRLQKYGKEASFPEFRGVIGALTREIFQNNEHYEWFVKHKSIELQQLIHKLTSIQINTRYMWPYRSTVLCIENMLEFIDIYHRNKNTYVNYYHNFRYRVYLINILEEPDQICFPTICILWTQHFIKTRCVPILLLGVAYTPLLADQYINTPLDFWAHDIQHVRRQIQETNRYYDNYIKHRKYYTNRSPFDLVTKLEFYEEMYKFTTRLNILITDDTINVQIRNMIRMIVFEIVHEKAWPITKHSICRNIQLKYDIFPIENIRVKEDVVTTFDKTFNDPTTLSNLRGKLRHGFYDPVNNPMKSIISEKYRTTENIAIAAELILDYLGFKGSDRYPKQIILALTKDKTNAEEFTNYGKEIDVIDVPEIAEYPDGFKEIEVKYFTD